MPPKPSLPLGHKLFPLRDAKVVLEAFFDLGCPFTKRMWSTLTGEVQNTALYFPFFSFDVCGVVLGISIV